MKKNWFLLTVISIILLFTSACQKDQLADLSSLSYTYSHPSGVLPVTISFVAKAPVSSTVTWDFGDGQTGTGLTTSHTYAAQGLYPVSVSASAAGQVTLKRMDTVHVFPYTQIAISQIDVTIPNPAYVHYKVFNSAANVIFEASYATPSTSGTSLSNSPVPPLVITDLEHSMKVEIWNYYNAISGFSFRPSTYFQNTLPFPAVFNGTDSQGRTVTMHFSWK
jgi:PKD repeat protein